MWLALGRGVAKSYTGGSPGDATGALATGVTCPRNNASTATRAAFTADTVPAGTAGTPNATSNVTTAATAPVNAGTGTGRTFQATTTPRTAVVAASISPGLPGGQAEPGGDRNEGLHGGSAQHRLRAHQPDESLNP